MDLRPIVESIEETARATPLSVMLQPFRRFARLEAAGGILLLACAVVGMAWANSPWADGYRHLWETTLTVAFGSDQISKDLLHWINDGLMVVFFFVVGLEIKREVLVGELASVRKASVPMFAAVGGMAVPALIYVAVNLGTPGMRGWGIPMATDIAFALGVLALLGRRVPFTLRVFLASLAIVDDIGALLVIAIFYTEELRLTYLAGAGGVLAFMFLMGALGLRRELLFVLMTIVLWVLVLNSGVHATIAGVLGAMAIPVRARVDTLHFLEFARRRLDEFAASDRPGQSILTTPAQQGIMDSLEHAAIQVQTPLQRLEHKMVVLSAFFVVPIFALANAGVPVTGHALADAATGRVSLGIFLGLLIGKPVGVFLATWIAVKSGLGDLPRGVTWRHIFGAGWLAGIGFTMALFIAGLAFGSGEQLDLAKMAILGASLVAGVVGWVVLATGPRPEQPADGH